MAEQERFSRRRHAPGEWPLDAMRFCLEKAQITINEVDFCAYSFNGELSAAESAQTFEPQNDPQELGQVLDALGSKGRKYPLIHRVSHHVSHFSSGYWLSGFQEAAGLVVDGRGEREATTLFHARGSHFSVLRQFSLVQSLGLLYDAAAESSGLGDFSAGKFMGLSAYGRPIRTLPIEFVNGYMLLLPEVLSDNLDDAFMQQYYFLKDFIIKNNYPYVEGMHESILDYADLASSTQQALEKAILNLSLELKQKTESTQLVIAGGLALNCSANSYLARMAGFEEIFIPPPANDGGVALGAALDVARHLGLLERGLEQAPLDSIYWGPEFNDEEISSAVAQQDLSILEMPLDDQVDLIAKKLADQKVVAWFKGRAEVGPRALGARSILASPANREMLYRINKLKGREPWRPLAPSVLAEHYDDFFTDAPASRFMLFTSTVREHQRNRISAVVHVDGTSRPQIVERTTNSAFYAVIQAFHNLTAIPLVINTSFNLRGQPIVNTPRDAISSFLESEIDLLVLGDYVLEKPGYASIE